MAIEIPNFFECGGLFDGRQSGALPGAPIVTSNGILPYEAGGTLGDPKGGFTRDSAGIYVVGADRSFDGLEVVCHTTMYAGSGGTPSPQIGNTIASDGHVIVKDVTHSSGLSDFAFYLAVLRIAYGPNAT